MALKAAALTALLADVGVSVAAVDGVYLATFGWRPARSPVFGDGTVADAFGLSPAGGASYPIGPFQRPRERELIVAVNVTRDAALFPGDGLSLIRSAVISRVGAYGLGEQLWLNDLLVVVEQIAGTRVTTMTVQHDSADVTGEDVPLDSRWTLPEANLTVTIT